MRTRGRAGAVGERTIDADPTSARNRAEIDSIRRRGDSINAHRRDLEQRDPAAAVRERDSVLASYLPSTFAPHGHGPAAGQPGAPTSHRVSARRAECPLFHAAQTLPASRP